MFSGDELYPDITSGPDDDFDVAVHIGHPRGLWRGRERLAAGGRPAHSQRPMGADAHH